MKKREILLNTEYCALNGFYWMLYSVVLSFAVVYLGYRGFSGTAAGFILAAANIIAMILQPIAGAVADKAKKISLISILIFMCGVTIALFALTPLMPSGSFALAAVYALLVGMVFSMQPLCNSFSFFLEGWGTRINFGVSRGIGSLTYALLAALLGIISENTGNVPVASSGLIVMGLLTLTLILFGVQKRRFGPKGIAHESAKKSDGQTTSLPGFIKKYKRFTVFLIAVAFLYFTHAMMMNFMIEPVKNVGGSTGDLGLVSAFTAIMELPAMFMFDRLARRFGAGRLLRFSAVMFTVKAFFYFFAANLPTLYLACFFQSMSFAVLIPASVRYASEVIDGADAVKGQASVTSMITLGAVFSNFFGGMMFDNLGVSPSLLICAIVSAVGTLIAFAGIEKKKRAPEKQGTAQ